MTSTTIVVYYYSKQSLSTSYQSPNKHLALIKGVVLMIKNNKIITCMILMICLFAVGCNATDEAVMDLGNLKGEYSKDLEKGAKLILMISNQSFYNDEVNLSIYIDEKLLVNETYFVGDQHSYSYYYISLEEGEHEISVEYNDEIIGEESVGISDEKPIWGALTYWEEKDTNANIGFHISDEQILIK